MRTIIKEKTIYAISITLLTLFMLLVSGAFASDVIITSNSGVEYGNGLSGKHLQTAVTIILSFWLGMLTPILFIKGK